MPSSNRILIFNVNWVGDVLFSTPVIRSIRRNYPGCYLACVIPPRCRQVLEGNPYLNEIIFFDERAGHRSLRAKLEFIGFLRAKKFDTAILLHRSMSRVLLCVLAGIRRRIGHNSKRRGIFLTTKIRPPDIGAVHRVDYYLSVIAGAGIPAHDRRPDFFTGTDDERFTAAYLAQQGRRPDEPVVVMNPGGNWLPKRWPVRHWAALALRLIRECNARIVVTGGESDKRLAAEIIAMISSQRAASSEQRAISTCGVFTLKHLGALARLSDVFISADSGPLHIAAASGARAIIALFGPTSPALTGTVSPENTRILQKNVGCIIPCYKTDCPDNRCMSVITPEEVFEQVKSALSSNAAVNGGNHQ